MVGSYGGGFNNGYKSENNARGTLMLASISSMLRISPGHVPAAGHSRPEKFKQNVCILVGCDGGHLDCMPNASFDDPKTAAADIVGN